MKATATAVFCDSRTDMVLILHDNKDTACVSFTSVSSMMRYAEDKGYDIDTIVTL